MTLVEMAIATTLTMIVLLSVGITTRSASGTYRTSLTEAQLAMRAHRALDRIAEELIEASQGSMGFLPGPENATHVEYRHSLGWDGQTTWTLPRAVRWEMDQGEVDDGLDNDGDGFVDEGRVVYVEDVGSPSETTRVLTRQVRAYLEGETPDFVDENGNGLEDERGFSISAENGVLTLRLTLEGRDPEGRLITKTVETAVVGRNGG